MEPNQGNKEKHIYIYFCITRDIASKDKRTGSRGAVGGDGGCRDGTFLRNADKGHMANPKGGSVNAGKLESWACGRGNEHYCT